MKIEKPVHVAWSPKCQYPLHLVAGTASKQFDDSVETSASIELYTVGSDNSHYPRVRCAFKSEHRFRKLIWSDYADKSENSIIVGGCDAGVLLLYNATALLRNETIDYERLPTQQDGLIACLSNHSGPVRGLDFNPFQKYLLATGATQSEIFIWDLNEDQSPMTPGAPAQPLDDVVSVSWNKEVKHIIASTFSTRCLIWDLRKNQPIIQIPDSASTIRWRDMKWNPQNATQLCLASEDDGYPVIQMYDLRSASSPIKIFEGHQKGILSLAWCSEDPDHLISCGKDDKLLVWNPNTATSTGEIINEVALGNEWNFEVNQSPRNPKFISCGSREGGVSIFSLGDGLSQHIVDQLHQSESSPQIQPSNQSLPPASSAQTQHVNQFQKSASPDHIQPANQFQQPPSHPQIQTANQFHRSSSPAAQPVNQFQPPTSPLQMNHFQQPVTPSQIQPVNHFQQPASPPQTQTVHQFQQSASPFQTNHFQQPTPPPQIQPVNQSQRTPSPPQIQPVIQSQRTPSPPQIQPVNQFQRTPSPPQIQPVIQSQRTPSPPQIQPVNQFQRTPSPPQIQPINYFRQQHAGPPPVQPIVNQFHQDECLPLFFPPTVNQPQQLSLQSARETEFATSKKTTGASFAFGGKLVSFGNQGNKVYISRAITEIHLNEKLKALDGVLEQNDVNVYCETKARSSSDPVVKNAWKFVAAGQLSGDSFKERIYDLLGTSQSSLQEKLNDLNFNVDAENEDSNTCRITRRNSVNNSQPLEIIRSRDIEGAISDALLLGNIELAVDLCLKGGKMTDAMALALSGGPELRAKTQSKYFEKSQTPLTKLISVVVTEDWRSVVNTYDLSNWKHVLVALLTYTKDEEFLELSELLGRRLSTEGDENLKKDSLICYICAGKVNEFVEQLKSIRTGSVAEIQEIAELGLLMEKSVKKRTGVDRPVGGALADVLSQYAVFLTSQGYLEKAYSYLGDSQVEDIETFKERLMYALGLKSDETEKLPSNSVGIDEIKISQSNSTETDEVEILETNYTDQYFRLQNPNDIPLDVSNNLQAGLNEPPKSVVKPYNEINQSSSLPTTTKPPVFAPTKPANAIPPPVASVKAYGFEETPVQDVGHVSPYTFASGSAPGQSLADTNVGDSNEVSVEHAKHVSPLPFTSHFTSEPLSTLGNAVFTYASTSTSVSQSIGDVTLFTPSVEQVGTPEIPAVATSVTHSVTPVSNPQVQVPSARFSYSETPSSVPQQFNNSGLFTPATGSSQTPQPGIPSALFTPVTMSSQTPQPGIPSALFTPATVSSQTPQPHIPSTLFTPVTVSSQTPQPGIPPALFTPVTVSSQTLQPHIPPALFTPVTVSSQTPQPHPSAFTPSAVPSSQPLTTPALFTPTFPTQSPILNSATGSQFNMVPHSATPTTSLPPPPSFSHVPYQNARQAPDHTVRNDGALPSPPPSRAPYDHARQTPDLPQNKSDAPTTLPPPPPSSQVPYSGTRRTPDYLMQTKNKYFIDPSLYGGTAQRCGPAGNFPPSSVAPNQPPMNPVASFPSSSETMQNGSSLYSTPRQSTNSQIPPTQMHRPTVQPEGQGGPLLPHPTGWIDSSPTAVQNSAPNQVETSRISSSSHVQGWNDPPPMAYRKSTPNQVDYNTSTPITHPLYGSAIPTENGNNSFPPSIASNSQIGGHGLPSTHGNGITSPTQTAGGTLPKAPLPEQHVQLQKVFDELHNLCFNTTANPHMKRKLNDIAGRLEILYDAIRSAKLSPTTLQGLHEIANAIEQGKYEDCLPIQTRLVSKCGSDFTTIASFLPGIKVLVYSAMQLGVRL